MFGSSSIVGIKQENISCPLQNSRFLETIVQEGDVKDAFTGNDHLNDLCGKIRGTKLESKLTSPWQSATSQKMFKYHENYYKINPNVDVVWDELLNQAQTKGACL